MNQQATKALENFLQKEVPTENQPSVENKIPHDSQTLKSKDGLIERMDKTLITQDGKILLRD